MTTINVYNETLAAGLARLWMRIYSAGLADDVRERRAQQLESDLWEHHADRFAAGTAPSMVGLEVIGRTVRGMPADLLWRFQLEGPKMNIRIPFERATGILLVVLAVVAVGGTSIAGYDTAEDGWESTLLDLGARSGAERGFTALWFMLCGLAMVGGAAGFYIGLQPRARTLATISSAFLATAGMLVLVSTASYWVMSELAVQFREGGDPSLVSTSRAFALASEWLMWSTALTLTISTVGILAIAIRERLVPRWLRWLVALAPALIVTGAAIGAAGDDGTSWVVVMAGATLMLLTLVIAGFTLLLGRRGASPPVGAVATP